MTDFTPKENSVVARNAATANLLINSVDRFYSGSLSQPSSRSSDFLINKPNSIMNGYFTRIGVQEVSINYGVYNVDSLWNNNTINFSTIGGSNITASIAPGNYSVSQALGNLNYAINSTIAGSGSPNVSSFISTSSAFANGTTSGQGQGRQSIYFVSTNNTAVRQNVTMNYGALADQLNLGNLQSFQTPTSEFSVWNPLLLPFTYLDFVSPQLTVNQALKDVATSGFENNILYRWNIAWPVPNGTNDALGYPIQQGYVPFTERRTIAFPKQIRYEPNIPVGQVAFQVLYQPGPGLNPQPLPAKFTTVPYTSTILTNQVGSTIGTQYIPQTQIGSDFEWNMTCLVSEN